MALDLLPGDLLVIGADEYPVRAVGAWDSANVGTSPAVALRLSTACTTKRPPNMASGLRAAPAAKLSGLYCHPLWPVNPSQSMQPLIRTAGRLLGTIVTDGTDYAQIEVVEASA